MKTHKLGDKVVFNKTPDANIWVITRLQGYIFFGVRLSDSNGQGMYHEEVVHECQILKPTEKQLTAYYAAM